MVTIRLNDTDEAILETLREGRNLPSNVAVELEVTRQYVSERMIRLCEHGLVRNVGNGVYELTEEGVASRERDHLKSFGKYADTNVAETADAVGERFDRDLRERRVNTDP